MLRRNGGQHGHAAGRLVARDRRARRRLPVPRLHARQRPLDRGQAARGVVGVTVSPASRSRRRSTGDAELDQEIEDVLERIGPPRDRDVLRDILVSAAGMAGDGIDRLDLKITSAALREMRAAFRAFMPYHDIPKATIFGSARTLPDDPSYAQARDLARLLARNGWMVVTGAGPGI